MRILFTSDWQADFENLELCRKAAEEVLRLKGAIGFEVLVLCGDLKHAYNPVNVKVINFWMRTISKWKNAGLEVVVDLGNHDRIGMHVDKANWFPVLRKAGALAYDEICFAGAGDGQSIAILPFRNNPVLLRRESDDLAKIVGSRKPVLVFHADLKNAKYNVLSRSEGHEGFSVRDLHPERYLYCIGGHIHLQQKVEGNTWYVGSPFATDWGEANQRKGYLLVDTEHGTIKKVRSEIPGWFDPKWPGFEEAKPQSWKGTKVRIKVPVNGVQHVRDKLAEAEERAAKLYVGASIVVVPEFRQEDERGAETIRNSFTDEKKIKIYVNQTIPDELRKHELSIRKYLVEQLAQVGGLTRENGELKFTYFCCENFLSYEKLKFRIEPGLCVVAGQNRDWGHRSNGSGKTSFLQPIAVAHSGQTFKDQKHDKWMRRGINGDVSYAKIWFNDSQDRPCTIKRSRQPRGLVLKVNNEILESGNRPEATQKLIEFVTGYTWETLSNAIYVDQTRSHLMLTGTEAERKGFLAKLQNLERFERAYKAIGDQKSDFEGRYELNSAALGAVLSEHTNLSDTISEAKEILAINSSIRRQFDVVKADYLEKKEELKTWREKAEKENARLDALIEVEEEASRDRYRQQATVEARLDVLKKRLAKFEKLQGECPTCQQSVSEEYIHAHVEPTEEAIRDLQIHLEGFESIQDKYEERKNGLSLEKKKWYRNDELERVVQRFRAKLEAARAEKEQFERHEKLLESLQARLKDCKRRAKVYEARRDKLGKWLSVLKYAHTVFKRDGLPSFLNSQICPELNQAAQEYAELFTQGEIQVRFAVDEEGRMDVKIINAHGGEGVADQSEGEMKMASLITSFAVRTIAPKTNILILDEPGDGLDATSARYFARGLKSVVGKFGTILLTTHNPSILAELSDARLVTVVKERGVSRVEE